MGRRHFIVMQSLDFSYFYFIRKPRTILWAIVLLSIFQFLMLIATIGIAFMPKEELGLSLPIMPLEDWVSQIQNRFHAFYANGIGLNVSMLPETVGLFLLGLYAGKKTFSATKELDPKLKMANHYVCFNITVLVLYGSLFLINIVI